MNPLAIRASGLGRSTAWISAIGLWLVLTSVVLVLVTRIGVPAGIVLVGIGAIISAALAYGLLSHTKGVRYILTEYRLEIWRGAGLVDVLEWKDVTEIRWYSQALVIFAVPRRRLSLHVGDHMSAVRAFIQDIEAIPKMV